MNFVGVGDRGKAEAIVDLFYMPNIWISSVLSSNRSHLVSVSNYDYVCFAGGYNSNGTTSSDIDIKYLSLKIEQAIAFIGIAHCLLLNPEQN